MIGPEVDNRIGVGEVENSTILPICPDCPSQLLRSLLEEAKKSGNPLDTAALQIACSMLVRKACTGSYETSPAHARGPVDRCGNDAEDNVYALFEQIGEISANFGLEIAETNKGTSQA